MDNIYHTLNCMGGINGSFSISKEKIDTTTTKSKNKIRWINLSYLISICFK